MDTPNGAEEQTALATRAQTAAAIVVRLERGLTPEPAADIETFVVQIATLGQRVNLLTPICAPSLVKPLHRFTWAAVQINPSLDGAEVYYSQTYHGKQAGDKTKVSLTKVALYNLIKAAGGSILSSVREDDGSDPHFRRMTGTVGLYTQDGPRTYSGSREMDLRPGSEQIKHISDKPKQLANMRARINELCETFAIERAIRAALSLQGSYTLAELKKPFFIVKCERFLDMSDPDQKKLALDEYRHATQNLFGSFAQTPPAQGSAPQPAPESAPVPGLPPPPALPPSPPEPEPNPEHEKLPPIDVQEEIGTLAGKIAKERGCDLGDVVQEFSGVKNKEGKTLSCRDPFDKRFEKSQKWARFTRQRLREELEDGIPDDSEVPE